MSLFRWRVSETRDRSLEELERQLGTEPAAATRAGAIGGDDMRSKRIASQNHERESFVAVFDKGDRAITSLTALARREGLGASQLTAIGGFSQATIGYFDRDRKRYQEIPVNEQVEVLSLLGDLVLEDGEPRVHAHVVLGRPDGTTLGGHLLEGEVWPTLEVILTEAQGSLRKRLDPETGLALIDLDAT